MESKDNIKNYNFKDNERHLNKDSTNQNFIPDKIINNNNNVIQKQYDFYPSKKEKQNDNEIKKQLCNDNKKEELLSKNLSNKMISISKTSQNNLPKKIVIMETIKKEKEGLLETKEEVDFFPDDDDEGKGSHDDYIENLNPKEEVQNIRNKNKKEINKQTMNLISEENNKIINDYENDIEKNKKTINHNRTFSNNINVINNNKNLNDGDISSFFYLTTKHLKEELEHDHSYYIDFNKSSNYIPKFNCNEDLNSSNDQINNIFHKNEILQNEDSNLNIGQNIYVGMYDQMNIIKNNSEKNYESISNKDKANDNKTNIINNLDNIINTNKDENIQDPKQKEEKTIDKDNSYNAPPFIPKKYENEYNQTQKIIYNIVPNINNFFNINNQRNENYIFNNNVQNNYKKNRQNLIYYNKFSNYSSNQIPSNEGINGNKSNPNINEEYSIIPQKNYDDLELKENEKISHDENIHQISLSNDNNDIKDNIPTNSNNINNTYDNIKLYYINYYKNNINLINPIIKDENLKKDEFQNEIKPQIDEILINNYVNSLNPDDYIIQMFNRFGWVCFHCNNFNFFTRKKCNRCQAIKMPKTKEEIFNQKYKKKNKKKKERKLDWICLNCKNLNFGFRKICNKCKIEKKDYFPLVYFEPCAIISNNNNKIIFMNHLNKMHIYFDNKGINSYANNFINNYKNNTANYNYNTNINNSFLNKMNTLGNNKYLFSYSNNNNNN